MITSPKYSFIQFSGGGADACCAGITDVALPVFAGTDLQFQVISDSAISSVDVVNGTGSVISSNSGFNSLGNNIYSFTGTIDISLLACEECFQLKIGTTLSNIFKKVCDSCYTSVLEYYNDEDYAGFLYCNVEFTNKVRLPFYLRKPKMNEDRTVYRKSDGTIRLTKSLITKQYILTTDYMTEQMHDCLAVAFGHDNTNVYNSLYSGGISKSGDYAPDWQDGVCVAPLDVAVDVTPIAIKNSNCQDCPDVTVCVAASVPSFSLSDAAVSNPYNQSITLGGTAPFTLSSITKPGWMTVSVSGSHVTFTGTPGTGSGGSGIPVSFTVSNACGTAYGSSTINVIIAPCNPVSISGSPSLPDIQVGVVYAYSFSLGGDAPFALSSITKPGWMTISVSGSTVHFSGTPASGDVGTGVAVNFTISNCSDSDSTSFSDDFSVKNNPSFVQVSNTNGSGQTRIQIGRVDADIIAGNVFYVVVYSHVVSYTAVGGDTPTSVAAALSVAINATTEGQWNDHSSAPPHGTNGFPPTSTSSGSDLTIVLNSVNQFVFGATFN